MLSGIMRCMITIRPAAERFHTQIDWLDSWHSFSFGDHYDPRFRGFRDLIVINEDRIAGDSGFGRHGHQNMEILTYVLDGELRHEDSLGTGDVIRPGEIQRMSAGTGILHSEMNPSSHPCHLLQIWILPNEQGAAPSYEQKKFSIREQRNQLHLIASPDGQDGSLTIHQNAKVYAGVFDAGSSIEVACGSGRYAWIQVARGSVAVNDVTLKPGDGAAISAEPKLSLRALESAEILIFDLP
jgi:redox-sensitive bicupin YhaK (pirin superfamily)